ncbi:MAG: flagellar biosynthesis protein FliP [Thermotogaceae bacterium]|jgi:flagellar biosynthetic protein FliP|nr:flagellar biosynthesis protein FliP [Thermotogaceae bacterium]MDN5337092.1 flagellar biosynthesis protein FliP [Thermotogaceae bacterium]
MKKTLFVFLLLILLGVGLFSQEEALPPLPRIEIGIGQVEQPRDLVVTLEIILILTILTLAPSILILMTSFTRIVIVFSFLRNSLGTRQIPPNQVLIGLALFLTFFIMQPVFIQIYNDALVPYMEGQITYQELYQKSIQPIRTFMLNEIKIHHNEDNIDMLLSSLKREKPENLEKTPTSVLIPAFVISELEIAFKMGILLYIPFIIIDMVTASVLLALGMIMIPPVLISLPFKVLVFVLVNGWDMLISSLIASF